MDRRGFLKTVAAAALGTGAVASASSSGMKVQQAAPRLDGPWRDVGEPKTFCLDVNAEPLRSEVHNFTILEEPNCGLTFQEWLRKQPRQIRRDIMGSDDPVADLVFKPAPPGKLRYDRSTSLPKITYRQA